LGRQGKREDHYRGRRAAFSLSPEFSLHPVGSGEDSIIDDIINLPVIAKGFG
jgi:hypothetical protein